VFISARASTLTLIVRVAWGCSEMAQKLESRSEAARRARSEFDSYADTVLLTEPAAAAVDGFSHHTYKFWRLSGSAKGPKPVYLHREIRRWRACKTTPVNEGPHMLRSKALGVETA
jgi:hypothetical protein